MISPTPQREERMFPVLIHMGGYRAYVPWSLVEPHEAQAQRNHSQTLQRLAERGGLGPDELLAVLEDRKWRRIPQDEAWAGIFRFVAASHTPSERAFNLNNPNVTAAQDGAMCIGLHELHHAAPQGSAIPRLEVERSTPDQIERQVSGPDPAVAAPIHSDKSDEGWALGPDGWKDVVAYVNDTPTLAALLMELRLLEHLEHHSTQCEEQRDSIFTITNHWRENELAGNEHSGDMRSKSTRPEWAELLLLRWCEWTGGHINKDEFVSLVHDIVTTNLLLPDTQPEAVRILACAWVEASKRCMRMDCKKAGPCDGYEHDFSAEHVYEKPRPKPTLCSYCGSTRARCDDISCPATESPQREHLK